MTFRTALWAIGCVLVSSACGSDVDLDDGGNSVVIEAHLQPDKNCVLDVDSKVVPRGAFDISRGGVDGSRACDTGYDLNLLVNNRVGSVVVFDAAEVTLQTLGGDPIKFDRDKDLLPNPLKALLAAPVPAKALGVVTVQAIPPAYARQLNPSKETSITAVVVLHGQTVSGPRVTSRTFKFPIDLCDGCMTMCYKRDVLSRDLDLPTVYGSECDDDVGADDRICIDTDC